MSTRSLIFIGLATIVVAACGGKTIVPAGGGGVAEEGKGSTGSSGSGGAGGSSAPVVDPGGPMIPAPPAPAAAPYDRCDVASDCAWGEIAHEIASASDCVCLFGCPSLPLSKSTVDRRSAQYKVLCTPGKDGNGHACPVDDCAAPPAIVCKSDHTCGARPPDAGI